MKWYISQNPGTYKPIKLEINKTGLIYFAKILISSSTKILTCI